MDRFPENLPNRFRTPEGFKTNWFNVTDTEHHIHYGYAIPEHPIACIYILPGLSEFIESYYETIHDCLARNFATFILNWEYQGRSGRFKPAPHKRHSDGFETDIEDLDVLINKHTPPNLQQLPKILLGHSTGGNIALRYMAQYPDAISAAALSAPLLGIYGFQILPRWAWLGLAMILKPFYKFYVPCGGPWSEQTRKSDGTDKFSSDPFRDSLHNAWCLYDKDLQVGNPTIGWVYEALKSINILHSQEIIQNIKAPCVFALAGQDKIVDTNAAKKFATQLKNKEIFHIPSARHEILQETDDIRSAFWDAFDKMLAEKIALS